ncbi:MAG TPA: polyprenol monophosphomannose synthase [Acidimicrobiales bacterium]|nr:polyprenol monophosphomannose synthase [Acidimicrobiales bacterium]
MGGDPVAELRILIPTYEEAGNIEHLLEAIASQLTPVGVTARVTVIDDNSPDGTGTLAEAAGHRLRSERFAVEVLRRPGKLGLGTAYAGGMRGVVEEASADWVLTMDADFSHHPSYLPAFVAAARTSDLVVGSRYVHGGATPDWPLTRRALSVGGNWYSRLWLGSAVSDWTGGFNLYSRGLLARCDLATLAAAGYGFQIELKRRALALCGEATELPIVFHDRSRGASKLPRATILDNLVLVPRLRFANPRRPAVSLAPERPVVGVGV